MKLLILFQIVALSELRLGNCQTVENGTVFQRNVRTEVSVRRKNNSLDAEESTELYEGFDDDVQNYDKNNLNFDYDQEEKIADAGEYQENHNPEKQMQEALLKAMKKPAIRKQIGEVIPILRVMSPAQRLTLAALVSSQIMSQNTLSESSLAEIATLFGGKNLESVEERNNVTEYLLLPISMDIAKMFRGIGREVGRNLRQNFYSGKSESAKEKFERRKVKKPLGVIRPPLPPPPPRYLRQPTAKRRIDGLEYYVFEEEDLSTAYTNGTKTESYRVPGKEDCDFFTKSLCLEVSNYPTEAIILSLKKNADIAKTFLADFDVQSVDDFEFSDAKIQTRGRQIETFERRRDERNEVVNGEKDESNFMCPSAVKYARPKRARATSGTWKYIVNAGDYTQTLRLEICMNPNAPCSYVTSHLSSECSQVFNYHRLLSWDENQGLHMDVFKVPSCCSCRVQGYSNFYPPAQGHTFAEKRREPVTVPSDVSSLPPPPQPPPPPSLSLPVHETSLFKVQNVRNKIESPNVATLKNAAASVPKSQKPKVVYQKVREYVKNPAEHLVPPGPPLPLENEGNIYTTYVPSFYDKKGPFEFNGPSPSPPQGLRYPSATEEAGQTTKTAYQKNEFGISQNKVSIQQTRFNVPLDSATAHQSPAIVITKPHRPVGISTPHLDANDAAAFEQGGQIRYVIPLVNKPLPLQNGENKKVKVKDPVIYTPTSSPSIPLNRDYKHQSGSGGPNLRSPTRYYQREYDDSQGVPSRLSPYYITPPKNVAAATTTTMTTTTTVSPAPKKSEIITASGHKKINYNYHPIIDFFKSETIKKTQPVYPISRL